MTDDYTNSEEYQKQMAEQYSQRVVKFSLQKTAEKILTEEITGELKESYYGKMFDW